MQIVLQHILLSGPSGIGDLILMALLWLFFPLLIIGLGIRKFIDFLKDRDQANKDKTGK